MAARRVLSQRTVLGPDAFTEVKVWQVDDAKFPDGVKVSFAYVTVEGGRTRGVYRIDNAHGAGLHEHEGDEIRSLPAMAWEALLKRFYKRVHELRGDADENQDDES
jgi:hypothetical protein